MSVTRLDEMLDWLKRNVGNTNLRTADWRNHDWYCSVTGRSSAGVTINITSDYFDTPFEAVEQCVQRVKNLMVNSRPLGAMLGHDG